MTIDDCIQKDSAAWQFCVKASFGLSVLATALGIIFLPADVWVKGYLAIGFVSVLATSFSLAKTLRDAHESDRLLRKVSDAKTQKILREYGTE